VIKDVGRRISRGANGKKVENSTIKPLSGGGQRKKRPKNKKRAENIALLSLFQGRRANGKRLKECQKKNNETLQY